VNTEIHSSPLRVWLVCQYFPPEITAAAFRLGGLAGYLQNRGMEVTVLTSRPHRSGGIDTQPDIHEAVRILRVPVTARSHLGQYVQFLLGARFRFRKDRRRFSPQAVLASSPPLSVFQVGRFLSRRTGAKLLLDVRDLWPDTPAALGRLRPGSRLFRFFKRFETRAYRGAEGISCVSRPMAEHIASSTSTPVVVAYNGVPATDLAAAMELERPKPPLKGEPLRVFYFGNLGLAQGLEILLRASERLDPQDFQVHLVGDGVKRNLLSRHIRAAGLRHVHLHPARPRPELLAEVARAAQVLFIHLSPQKVFSRTIPSKLFDYLLLRRPVVAGINGEGAEILAKAGCAADFDPGRVDSLVGAMTRAARNWKELNENAERNNMNLLRGFLREDQYAKMEVMIRACCEPGKSGEKVGGSG